MTYIPIFKGLLHYGNPALERAIAAAPVVIHSNECSVRAFSAPVTDCEKVRELLNSASVPHTLVVASTAGVSTTLGNAAVSGFDATKLRAAIKSAGYPDHAASDQINRPMVVCLLFILVLYVCMGYGPIAAYLVELFPTKVRYSSISMPYHIGTGYFGGFMLYFATLITTTTGDIFAGLWYPIVIAIVSLLIGLVFLPETKDWDINR